MAIEKPCRVFCCYARKDQEFLQDLKTHLKSLERDGLINVKSDMDISPGAEWEREINNHLGDADIILLLISPDFIASDYCYDKEMLQAIARHEQRTARVIPVILRPANWHSMPFGKLQALPKDATPISITPDRDTALLSVTKGIRAIAVGLTTGMPINHMLESDAWLPAKEDITYDSCQERNNVSINNNSGKYTFNDRVKAEHIGDNIYNFNQKDGTASLKKGTQALLDGDYSLAKKELRVAVNEIDRDKQPREVAQAYYLLALALLDGRLPRSQGDAVIQSIEKSMNSAIKLYPSCASYYRIFACIEKDVFEHNGLSYRLNEVRDLERKGASLPRSVEDEENEGYFRQCQPNLRC